ncbi:CYTL1 domain-containing protein [Pseudorasbora parva]|uniref:CYTL1 domain-containing protein n=1 Tax=Pseudorasbora parva TaxID=51549 RepID=UPI00351F2C5D
MKCVTETAVRRQKCCSQGADSMLAHTALVLVLMPVVWAQPYPIPPTCYTKVLNMAKEITQTAAEIKQDHSTVSLTRPIEVSTIMHDKKTKLLLCFVLQNRCTAHLPNLYIDVHNACVISTMNTYLSLLGVLRERRCSYTRKVQSLASMIRQLQIIMLQKCHGDLVYTDDNCEALHYRG